MKQNEEDKARIDRAEARKAKPQSHVAMDIGKRSAKHIAELDKEIHRAMMKLVTEEIDVAEIYSPDMAEMYGRV